MGTPIQLNGRTKNLQQVQQLSATFQNDLLQNKQTTQQMLIRWYAFFKTGNYEKKNVESLFDDDLLNNLLADLEWIPELLMDELIHNSIADKEQYIRLIQALLINLSDRLPESEKQELLRYEVENVLQFVQHFFYQLFDWDYRVSVYCLKYLQGNIRLKLEYWNIKLQQSPLINVLQDCIDEKSITSEHFISFRKLNYLKQIFRQIEASTSVIHENFIRELLFTYNFNTTGFIEYEISLIKNKLATENGVDENIALLRKEQIRIAQLKEKLNVGYEMTKSSVKQQINHWIIENIKIEELAKLKKNDKDLQIEPESKIQTSFSVAKLAILIRLLVADKIIINKTVAPMLRTVSKLFTTLQKDDISYGSLETKYHAPDKATLDTMKDMLQKWVGLVGKL